MYKVKMIVEDAPLHLVESICDVRHKVRKVVSIGENISVPFCGREECEKIAMKMAEDIFKSLQTTLKSEKKYAKMTWFLVIKKVRAEIVNSFT